MEQLPVQSMSGYCHSQLYTYIRSTLSMCLLVLYAHQLTILPTQFGFDFS